MRWTVTIVVFLNDAIVVASYLIKETNLLASPESHFNHYLKQSTLICQLFENISFHRNHR